MLHSTIMNDSLDKNIYVYIQTTRIAVFALKEHLTVLTFWAGFHEIILRHLAGTTQPVY